MKTLLEHIAAGELIIADGAMGSMLLDRAGGLIQNRCPETINLSHPDILEEIAALYLEAGAEILQTNTFGASPLKLADYRLEKEYREINRSAVRAVRKIAGERAWVSASFGPSGKMMKPYGPATTEEIFENFRLQAVEVIDEGADVICVETMSDIQEAAAAVRAVRSVSASIPVMASMTYNKTPRGFFTVMGVTVETACGELVRAGANIIGSNCGNGVENMILLAREYRLRTSAPLIFQANAGLPEIIDGRAVYPETPAFMAEKALEMKALGVAVIGGCCGTTPEHIRAFRNALKPVA